MLIAPPPRRSRLWTTLAGAMILGACASHPVPMATNAPAVARVSFLIDVPEPGSGQPSAARAHVPPCLHATRFGGVVYPGTGEARVLISPAYVNVERHNDKRRDQLIARVEVAEGRRILGIGSNVEYRFGPTVDTAGPSLTTWQASDTLRLLLPWPSDANPKWLLFFISYDTITHGGVESECAVILRSDTLRAR